VLDLSDAFAPGQVYVALSRLSSIEGLVLSSPLRFSNLRINEIVAGYAKNKQDDKLLNDKLALDEKNFLATESVNAFDFNNLSKQLYFHIQSYDKDEKKSAKQKHQPWAEELASDLKEPRNIAEKFQAQLKWILGSSDNDRLIKLHQRLQAAKGYFEPLLKEFSKRIFAHGLEVGKEKGVKKYLTELIDIERLFFKQLHSIYKAEALIKSTLENSELQIDEMLKSKLYTERREMTKEYPVNERGKKTFREKKEPKVPTKEVTFNIFREGKSISEIAKERSLATSTIEGHFIPLIKSGEVKVTELLGDEKIQAIIKAAEGFETPYAGSLKGKLGDDFSYNEIRMVLASLDEEKTK